MVALDADAGFQLAPRDCPAEGLMRCSSRIVRRLISSRWSCPCSRFPRRYERCQPAEAGLRAQRGLLGCSRRRNPDRRGRFYQACHNSTFDAHVYEPALSKTTEIYGERCRAGPVIALLSLHKLLTKRLIAATKICMWEEKQTPDEHCKSRGRFSRSRRFELGSRINFRRPAARLWRGARLIAMAALGRRLQCCRVRRTDGDAHHLGPQGQQPRGCFL